ncbi:Growth hormone secretagogue receptor type 1 [Pseudolycoriella hygida]|uniref:Growth hormone secretagogue receptor type 1 n=1 Tax=Pseudolycoriella hygida TaxID=35572 RepID=A0A9Q0MQA5_9DIPT|nr:Growth hormone secretagogue receptor type 1 [Pseudolycoriella hygida]
MIRDDDEWLELEESFEGKAVPFVELTVAHASVLTILAISFERYYAICEPLKAGYVCTKARALLICLAAWAVAAVFTSNRSCTLKFEDKKIVRVEKPSHVSEAVND